MTDRPAAALGATRPKILLLLTSIVFALWIAALLAMFFTTVYPHRQKTSDNQVRNVE